MNWKITRRVCAGVGGAVWSATALLASASAAAATSGIPPFAAGETWVGTYNCGNRQTDANLQLKSLDRLPDGRAGEARYTVRGQFSFGGNGRPTGTYEVEGEYAANQPQLVFRPKGWLNLPPGYVAVGLSGALDAGQAVYAGRVDHPACSAFTLVRSVADGKLAAASSAPTTVQAVRQVANGGATSAVADAALFERFVYRDPGVNAALRQACPERTELLRRLSGDFGAGPVRPGEAIVALAATEGRRECGLREGTATMAARGGALPAAGAMRRVEASTRQHEQLLATLARLDTAVGQWPAPPRSTPAVLPASEPAALPCADEVAAFDRDATAAAFSKAYQSVPLAHLLWYWGSKQLGERVLCTRPSPDGYTAEIHIDWAVLAGAWHAVTASGDGNVLTAADAASVRERLQAYDDEQMRVAEAERKAEKQRKWEREQDEQRAQAQAEATEREFGSYLSKAKPPQDIYMMAGKYERAADKDRASKLYAFLVEAFPKTPWAVKANDRLLAFMEGDKAAARAAASATRPATQSARGGAVYLGSDPFAEQRQQEAMRQQWERDEDQRRREEAEFNQRRNEQIRQQNERWAEEERRRQQQPN